MKNKFIKFISSILVIASLVSCFGVLSFAASPASEDGEEDSSNVRVIFNRDFDDGWDVTNGLSMSNEGGHDFYIGREELADYSYNHYMAISQNSDTSGHVALTYDAQPVSGGSILEFDIKVDDYYNVGNIIYYRTPGASAGGTLGSICGIYENQLKLFDYTVGLINQGWVHVGYVMNFDQSEYLCHSCRSLQTIEGAPDLKTNDGLFCSVCGYDILYHRIKFRVYFSLSDYWEPENAIDGNALSGKLVGEDLVNTYYFDYVAQVGSDAKGEITWNKASIDFFRIGPGLGSRKNTEGQKVMFDNLKLYSDPTVPEGEFMPFNDLEGMGYGTKVNEKAPTTVDVGTGGSLADVIKEGVVMKTGSNYLLHNDERQGIYTDSETGLAYGAPRKIDGQVYVPFEPILNMTGYPYMWHKDGISCDISTANGSSILTVGRDTAVVNGERVKLTAAPQYLKSEKTDDVYPAIALEDVELFFPGWFVTYDTMGLIAICSKPAVFNRDSDLKLMMDYMKSFVFDYYTAEQFYDAVKENTNNFDHPYIMADQDTMDYIYAVYTGEVENETLKTWLNYYANNGEKTFQTYTTKPTGDAVAKEYLADGSIKDWSEKDPDYNLLWYELNNCLENGINHGLWVDQKYDYGQYPFYKDNIEIRPYGYVGKHYNDGAEIETGRVGAIQSISNEIESVAIAYVVTRDLKYAELCWEMCVSFMKFRHWGQHQFLAVAEVGHSLGCVFDWLYDVWTDEFNFDTNALAQAMYEKIVWFGYAVTMDKGNTDWFEDYSIQPGTTNYNDMTINWNAVCTSGLTICELSIIGTQDKNGVDAKQGYDRDGKKYTEVDFTTTRGHFDNSAGLNILYFTMQDNFRTLCQIGLNQYPPDGSFIESPGYWSFATCNLADMIWALTTAVGDDLGLLEFGGMDTTWYFPIYTEFSSDVLKEDSYCYWAFHDSSPSQASTDCHLFIADAIGDYGLAAYRLEQLKGNKKSFSFRDVLGYKPEYAELTLDDVSLNTEYIMENLDGITTRESWDERALFTGIMGDANNITAHGQIDCGNWMYSNLGYTWITDCGADEYDLYDYFSYPVRHKYYRNNGEGHNTLIVTSLPDTIPNGQLYAGKAPFQYDKYLSNEYGVKAILDGTSLFAPYSNQYYRGLLFTNDRSTVVIQDQMGLKSALDICWIAHTEVKDLTLSDDGRTAYLRQKLYDNQTHTVRLTIVEERKTDLKFEIIDAGVTTFLLESTHGWDYSESMGKEPEYSRDKLKRLVIRDDAAMNFNVAVVVELLDLDESTTSPVEYDYQDMRDWIPEKEYTGINSDSSGSGSGGKDEVIETLTPKDIISYANECKRFVDTNYAFTTRTRDFFKALARVNNGFNSLNIDRYQGVEAMQTAYANYKEYMKQYAAFKDDVNSKLYMDITLTRSFSGV